MKAKELPTADLIPYARNSRTHSDQQVTQIAGSIREFGFLNPVIIDEEKTIIAGHGRVLAAAKMKLEKVPCVQFSHLTDAQKRAYVIADNRLAMNAGWDEELLANELSDLFADDFELDLLGFDADELEKMLDLDTSENEFAEDEVPEPPADPVTQPGDLWLLGQHRLLCGDSTIADDVARLMNGAKADMCFTSPPYALGKSVSLSGNRIMSAKENAYDTHEDNAAEWAELMAAWFAASDAAVAEAWVVNVQPLAGNKRDLIKFVAANNERLVDVATWDKGHAAPPMAAGVMASRYEWFLIFASVKGASRAIPLSSWRGTVQSVYSGSAQRQNEFSAIHAATMPIHVPVWVMQTLCDRAESVYEPFCGTGTTLIAAEQLNRKCYGMEISPQYCDVIIQRWENLTGDKARKAD